jgi:hypothetical protein
LDRRAGGQPRRLDAAQAALRNDNFRICLLVDFG